MRLAQAQTELETHADAVTRLDSTVSPATARAIQATENATRAIEEEFGLLNSSQVAERLGSKGSHRSFASEMRKRGELLYLRRLNAFYYPAFQFEPRTERTRPVIEPLIRLAGNAGWEIEDVVLWLCSPTTYIEGGGRPVDHIDDADRVLDVAARAWGVEW